VAYNILLDDDDDVGDTGGVVVWRSRRWRM